MRREYVGLNVKNMQPSIFNVINPSINYLITSEQSTKMTYEVQTWDAEEYCVNYHTVADAIDYEDARDVIQAQYPDQKVIAVVKKK